MAIDNDTRGWIMTCMSALACVVGSLVICIDLIVRLFPGQKNFRIQDSNTFLSSSLSLSFGVMLFSSMNSMLPSAKQAMLDGGFSPSAASWALIGFFLAGAFGISILSRIIHRFIPHNVVDCDHHHDEDEEEGGHHHHSDHAHDANGHHIEPHNKSHQHSHLHRPGAGKQNYGIPRLPSGPITPRQSDMMEVPAESQRMRRPSLHSRMSTRLSRIVSGSNYDCDDRAGACKGYSDPCGTECFESIKARGGSRAPVLGPFRSKSAIGRTISTGAVPELAVPDERQPLLNSITEVHTPPRSAPGDVHGYFDQGANSGPPRSQAETPAIVVDDEDAETEDDSISTPTKPEHHSPHHHHVPTNAFLSIGLQTSIAIALHKLPEGFITYATNHANPQLGFAVFLALFIHNITEGFAMALPLYLAFDNRLTAIFWASILGGASQPLGAAIAALWLRMAGSGDSAPGEGVYGVMFAITAGVMASVALNLFSESLDLTHNRTLCMVFAFVGIAVLGFSNALTA